MSQNFWKDLKQPITALAPMEDVTDTSFRETILRISNPERLKVIYTEFTNTDGLCHPIGRPRVSHRLYVSDSESKLINESGVKLVAQIWGANPEKFREAVEHMEEDYQFDGYDINMGCPVKKITKHGACSALIGTPALAREIIQAVKGATAKPVSVKTRTGLRQHNTAEWLSEVFAESPEAVILHARTKKDESKVDADWEQFHIARQVRDELAPGTPLLGNGDIFSWKDIEIISRKYGLDGSMIGRGIFHNPWMFSTHGSCTSPDDSLSLLWLHTRLFMSAWGDRKHFLILRRFFKIYANSFYGAHELRAKLMETLNIDDVEAVLKGSGVDYQRFIK